MYSSLVTKKKEPPGPVGHTPKTQGPAPPIPEVLVYLFLRLRFITEAARTLAVAAGVAALAIRRMSVGALGPGEDGDRLWSRRRGSNIIKIDGWTLPGPCAP